MRAVEVLRSEERLETFVSWNFSSPDSQKLNFELAAWRRSERHASPFQRLHLPTRLASALLQVAPDLRERECRPSESEAPAIDDIHADKDGTGPQNSMNFSKELVLQQRCRNVMKHG
jgi:hypothetical protein